MAALLGHAEQRHASPDGQLLRYRNGRRITHRRYDHLWDRLGRYLPWVRAQQISMHWIRHILSACFRVAIAAIGGQADLRPVLFDYLFLAAAYHGTT